MSSVADAQLWTYAAAPVALGVAGVSVCREYAWAAPVGLGATMAAGAMTAAALLVCGMRIDSALMCGAASVVCALIAESDRRRFIIPDLLVVALLMLGAAAAAADGKWLFHAAGALGLGSLFWAVRGVFAVAGRPGLGMGDVKLAFAMGALVGPQLGLIAVACAAAGTAVAMRLPGHLTAAPPSCPEKSAPLGVGLSIALAAVLLIHSGASG